MDRITKLNCEGVEYALDFSLNAAEEVFKRYGDLNVNKALFTSEDNNATIIDVVMETVWLLELLTQEGSKYFLKKTGEKYPVFDAEALMLMPFADVLELRVPVLNAIATGMLPTVEVKPDKKNEETETEK